MKKPNRLALPAVMAAVLITLTQSSSAAIVADFNFDSLAIGSTPPTTSPGTDPIPQGIVYSIDGFPDVGPLTGTVTVENVAGLNKAALMTTTQGGTGAHFIDTQMLVTSAFSTISFDLAVIDVPFSPLLAQATGGAPNGQAFVVHVFNMTDRLFRFAVAPTSATEGIFGFRDLAGNLTTVGTYTEGSAAHRFDFVSDHAAGLVDVYMNGNLVLADQPVLTPTTGVSEIFIFQNGVEGLINQVAIDNIVFDTAAVIPSPVAVTAVPEPTTALFGLALIGACAASRRRRERQA